MKLQKGAVSTENLILLGLVAIALIIGIAKYGGKVEEKFGGAANNIPEMESSPTRSNSSKSSDGLESSVSITEGVKPKYANVNNKGNFVASNNKGSSSANPNNSNKTTKSGSSSNNNSSNNKIKNSKTPIDDSVNEMEFDKEREIVFHDKQKDPGPIRRPNKRKPVKSGKGIKPESFSGNLNPNSNSQIKTKSKNDSQENSANTESEGFSFGQLSLVFLSIFILGFLGFSFFSRSRK